MKRLLETFRRSFLYPLLFCVALSLQCGGCSKPTRKAGVEPTDIAGKNAIVQFLVSKGVQTVIAADPVYYLPNRAWVEGFRPKLAAAQLANGVATYEDPANNCNKFAAFARTQAHVEWFHNPDRLAARAIAWGEIWYSRGKNRDGHAINIIIGRDKSGELDMRFFEPQSAISGNPYVTLTEEELALSMVFF